MCFTAWGGFYTPDSRNALLAGVRYFRGPSVGLTDEQGFPAGTARPQDLSAEVGYGRRIGRNLAFSLTVRYVRSDQGFGEKPMQGVSFGLRLADIGPDVKASDGERCGLPIRGSLGGSLHLPFRSNHVLGIALDLSHQFRGGITGLAAGAEYTFFRHGVVRGGYHFGHKNKGTGNYASLGCGFIAGPVRCDAAWRLGGDKFNPLNDTFLFSVGFLL